MTLIAFIDTETLGLDPDRHAIWEVGLVLYNPTERTVVGEWTWQLALDAEEIAKGDPVGMEIGGFNDRYDPESAVYVEDFFDRFLVLTAGAHLAGAVVSFDEERLRRLARQHGYEHRWHYHLIDVENLAIGYFAGRYAEYASDNGHDGFVARRFQIHPPWKSDDLGKRLGVTISEEDRHTALGDARWALRMYQEVMARD